MLQLLSQLVDRRDVVRVQFFGQRIIYAVAHALPRRAKSSQLDCELIFIVLRDDVGDLLKVFNDISLRYRRNLNVRV